MVARLFDVKEALKQTMNDVEWDMYVRTLLDTQAQEVRKLILSDDYDFWQSCANY